MLQVELRQRRVWGSDGSTVAHSGGTLPPLHAQGPGPVRVYGHVGCGEVACGSEGWTVHHSAVVLVEDLESGLQKLRGDAAAVRSHIRSAHGGDLMAGEFAVNVQVAWLGENHDYQMEAQVRPRPCCYSVLQVESHGLQRAAAPSLEAVSSCPSGQSWGSAGGMRAQEVFCVLRVYLLRL